MSSANFPRGTTPRDRAFRPRAAHPAKVLGRSSTTLIPLALFTGTDNAREGPPIRHLLWDSALDPACGRRRAARPHKRLAARRDAAKPPRPAACLLVQTRPPAPRSAEQVADRGASDRRLAQRIADGEAGSARSGRRPASAGLRPAGPLLALIHISEPTRQAERSYAVFCLKKKKTTHLHLQEQHRTAPVIPRNPKHDKAAQ